MSKKNKRKLLVISGAVLIPLLIFFVWINFSNLHGRGGILTPGPDDSNPQSEHTPREPQEGEEEPVLETGTEEDTEGDGETAEDKAGGGLQIPLGNPEPSDKRELLFKGLEENIRLYDGCLADIRIRYANGEEYTVLKSVKLVLEKEESPAEGTAGQEGTATEKPLYQIFSELNELEMLYLSSALTDCVLYTGTTLTPVILRGAPEEDSVGNYRPVREVLTLINEEGFLDTTEADVLFLARERLEERLLNSSVYYREAIKDALTNGVSEQGAGYWLIN